MYNTTENNKTDVAMYAVFRNGVRVSDSEYDSKAGAQGEYMYGLESFHVFQMVLN